MNRKIIYIATAFMVSLFFPLSLLALDNDLQDGEAVYSRDGANTCLECHDTAPATLILNTPHAQSADSRTPFANHACETCHGASPDHLRKEEGVEIPPLPAMVFGANSVNSIEDQNSVCLTCHEGGLRINWEGSQHHSSDVSCATCHDLHAFRDPVLVQSEQPEVCYECHKGQEADSHKRSHHPISEGQVTCSDCHNPHGTANSTLLVRSSVNDTCYTCHAEKRGPFLWEHAPVQDDCTNCHTPHGSNQPRLLKVRSPFICQECHQENFHPSTLYSGTGVAPNGAGERIVGKQCMNCHVAIHGSNHPSGSRLTR